MITFFYRVVATKEFQHVTSIVDEWDHPRFKRNENNLFSQNWQIWDNYATWYKWGKQFNDLQEIIDHFQIKSLELDITYKSVYSEWAYQGVIGKETYGFKFLIDNRYDKIKFDINKQIYYFGESPWKVGLNDSNLL